MYSAALLGLTFNLDERFDNTCRPDGAPERAPSIGASDDRLRSRPAVNFGRCCLHQAGNGLQVFCAAVEVSAHAGPELVTRDRLVQGVASSMILDTLEILDVATNCKTS
jgi:hypothetical protein